MKNQVQDSPSIGIDLKNTLSIDTPSGGKIFQQGILLRKVSKFLAGAEEDAILPIPIFYDPSTGKILSETVPLDLREEYKDHLI
jgi:hypothetical protein